MADFKIPSQPVNLFPMPFADEGAKTIIPDETAPHGRATIPAGFPTETQLPLNQGGVAPNRLDFQGILHMLSAFSFWQQSGGMFSYNPELNYASPALVFHNGFLWWNVSPCGPATTAGAVEPGTDEGYWLEFLRYLAQASGDIGTPVGTVIMYSAATPPEGYLVCNGQTFSASAYPRLYAVLGSTAVPDMRGLFVRGYDQTAVNDPNGSGRAIRTQQGDAIRDIQGRIDGISEEFEADGQCSGVFEKQLGWRSDHTPAIIDNNGTGSAVFRASKVVPTAAENRPKNINLLYCIKHD